MNLALVLSGGAARGAFHLGFLHYCEQNYIEINAYSASSVGSIIAASHASGVKAKEQLKIFSSKEIQQAIKFNYFKKSLLKIDTNNKLIKELLPIKNLEDIPKEIFVSAYDIKEKKLHYFNSGDTATLCIASSALIPLFKPIKYKNMQLIDGGYFDNIPIKPLENKDYNIFAIDLFPKNTNKKRLRINPLKIIKRKLFTQLYDNHKYTLENSHYYLGSSHIKAFSLFTFTQIQDCFELGLKKQKITF